LQLSEILLARARVQSNVTHSSQNETEPSLAPGKSQEVCKSMIRLIERKDHYAVGEAAAKWVISEVRDKPKSDICLAAGCTHVLMCSMLVDMSVAHQVSFGECTFFAMDEYLGLERDSPYSLHHMLEQSFVSRIGTDKARFKYLDSVPCGPEAEAVRYEREIAESGGLDLAISGIGTNGHIGFNEPGSVFNSRTRVVNLTRETIEQNACQFPSAHKLPTRALTSGIGTLLQAKKMLLLASGKNKARPLYDALMSSPRVEIPASALQLHPDTTTIADSESLEHAESEAPDGSPSACG